MFALSCRIVAGARGGGRLKNGAQATRRRLSDGRGAHLPIHGESKPKVAALSTGRAAAAAARSAGFVTGGREHFLFPSEARDRGRECPKSVSPIRVAVSRRARAPAAPELSPADTQKWFHSIVVVIVVGVCFGGRLGVDAADKLVGPPNVVGQVRRPPEPASERGRPAQSRTYKIKAGERARAPPPGWILEARQSGRPFFGQLAADKRIELWADTSVRCFFGSKL